MYNIQKKNLFLILNVIQIINKKKLKMINSNSNSHKYKSISLKKKFTDITLNFSCIMINTTNSII